MKISLPLSIVLPRKTKIDKVFILNLNTMRNTHYHIMNDAKVAYKNNIEVYLAASQIINMPSKLYRFTYTVFPSSGRVFDLGNVLPAVAKFAEDALQELQVITNDNYKVIREVVYKFGEIDKEFPRVELEITKWEI